MLDVELIIRQLHHKRFILQSLQKKKKQQHSSRLDLLGKTRKSLTCSTSERVTFYLYCEVDLIVCQSRFDITPVWFLVVRCTCTCCLAGKDMSQQHGAWLIQDNVLSYISFIFNLPHHKTSWNTSLCLAQYTWRGQALMLSSVLSINIKMPECDIFIWIYDLYQMSIMGNLTGAEPYVNTGLEQFHF